MAKVTLQTLREKKAQNDKLCVVTCYDATFAKLVDRAGADIVLVGDSLGTVIKGEKNTLGVTLDEVAYHTRAVARGIENAHLVADLPFMSYHRDDAQAIESAGKLLCAGAHSVKLEGGQHLAPRAAQIVRLGIPVMGHIGLMPQSLHAQSGYVIQGRNEASQQTLIADALALEDAGVFALVLEGIQSDVAKTISERVRIPTIGIGAGPHCDGQVLVLYDLLGLDPDFKPKFVKQFANGALDVQSACQNYFKEVKKGLFPSKDHSFHPAQKPAVKADSAHISLSAI